MHDAPAMATLFQATLDSRPPTPPTSPPLLEDENSETSVSSQEGVRRPQIVYNEYRHLIPTIEIGEETKASLWDIHYIDSSSGSEEDGTLGGRGGEGKRCGAECECGGRRGCTEGACEEANDGGGGEDDVVLIHDEEVCAAERRRRRSNRAPRGTTASATVGGGEHTAAPCRSCCHDGGGPVAVVTAAAPPSSSTSFECIMKHKCGRPATASDLGDQAAPHASMAAPDAALQQQQQQQQPAGSGGSAMVTTSSSGSSTSGGGGGAPLRSALKRAGQKSRGHRVCINEAKNECLEADYVILVHEENEPQLVSIRSFDLSLAPGSSGVEQVTLSPPEGYKDCFTHHHALHQTLVDESGVCDLASVVTHVLRMGGDTESGSGDGLLDLDTPRPHLPDLVTHRTPPTQLTVENVRHHDQLMQGKESDGNDPKVAKTGILKGGKLWKNGDTTKKTKPKVEVEEVEEPRRSVRFSGRDEYSMLENLPLDKIPLDAANSAALARFMPKLRELGMLLGEARDDWHVELSPINPEAENIGIIAGLDHHPLEEEKQPPPQMDDEQISESMQRYEEMRRRIAAAEGRDNTSVCSDESKSSSDSQSSDSTMTETRIRRLENSDMAHVAGGVMRSNSEVRRAIERNALRRSLTRFSDTRKKDTNKNERNERGETSILEKLRWLTATEDATNGNDQKEDGDNQDGEDGTEGQDARKEIDPRVQETIAQYRKLAEMFNKTTSLRTTEILVPGDVREWKLQADLFPEQKLPSIEPEPEELPEPHSGSTTPTVYQAIPVVSIAELVSDEDCDKLIYSGGVRYTREGTLPVGGDDDSEEQEGDQQTPTTTVQTADARKQFLSTMSGHPGVPLINGVAGHSRDRSSMASNSDSYTFDDIDEALHDDRSSSVPSSSQSSPRLSGRSDMDGTSTTESGYSSNETNGELCPVSTAQLLEVPPGGVDVDELAEFVRQDAGRMERLRRRYDAGEQEDYGFNRRPSVRGIKPRFGSTTDLLKQMANQLAPPAMAQPGMAGSHMTWPYREGGEEDAGPPQRRRAAPNRAVLPALQEDILYIPTSDLSPQTASSPSSSTATATSLTHTKAPRVVHVYSSTGDLRAPPPSRLQGPRESPPPDLIRPGAAPMPNRPHSHVPIMSQVPLQGSVQSLVMAPQMPTPNIHEHHHPTCRRPASVHGHLPPDTLVTRGVPPPPITRPHSTLSHYPPPRVPVHYHPYEEPPLPRSQFEGGHPPLAQRGSYPGTVPAPVSTPHYIPQVIPNDPARYPNPPPYGSHPHTHPPIVSPREGVPYTRMSHPIVHSVPQVSPIAPGPVQVHQCGPRHPLQPRMVGGTISDPACSPVWSHQLIPSNVHQAYPPHPVSSHLSYTTPIVPESGVPSRPSGLSVGPSIGPLIGPPLINGTVGKLEGLRDERGVPEGASSSPRGHSDPQYPPPHTSPTRDSSILHRHPPPMNMT